MRERRNVGLFLGMLGNILFIGFAAVCMIYYATFSSSVFTKLLEGLAYTLEIGGFMVLAYSDYLLCVSTRMRRLMKISFALYILFESIMMILELNSASFDFYAPYSLKLAVFHSLVSAGVCFAFLQADPDSKKYEYLVIMCIGIIFIGMLGSIMHIRIYFSILINAIAFTVLFGGIRYLLGKEEMEIDCHGDKATVSEYNSDFFKDK